MSNRITRIVDSVTKRRRLQSIADHAVVGLLFGGAVSVLLTLLWILDSPLIAHYAVGCWTFGPITFGFLSGLTIGFLKRIDPRQSAGLIDRHYHLKDRVLTAFQNSVAPFNENDWPEEAVKQSRIMRLLQFSDASDRIGEVDSAAIVPFRIPRHVVPAMILVILIGILSLVAPRLALRKTVNVIEPIEELAIMAEEVKEEILPELAKWEKENPDEETIRELREEMEKLIPELTQETSDPKETLATLSEMESAISEAIQAMDLASMEAAISELADALKSSDATQTAGEALRAGNYDQVASELEKIDPNQMTSNDRKKLADRLAQAVHKMTRPSQKELASQAERFGRSLRDRNQGESFDSASRIVGFCKNFSLRKGIRQSLDYKLALLSLCKSGCCQSACRKNGGNKTGKSNSSSKNWGNGSAGDPRTGEETEMAGANRTPEKITGTFGDGPSEFETIESNEGSGTATRNYREAWHDYRKISESVLHSEPIPLGKRQMIRRYFESIRPNDESVQE